MIICKECGSSDVQEGRWVNPNTLEIGDFYNPNVGWCVACDESATLVDEVDVIESAAHVVTSSQGTFYLDEEGIVLYQQRETADGPRVVSFDLDEYRRVWQEEPPKEIDILDLRGTLEDGSDLIFNRLSRKLKELA